MKWLLDNAASHHFYISRNQFFEYIFHNVDVNTVNGKTRFRDIGKIRITLGDQELVLRSVIYMIYLHLNILSTERLKKNSCISYNNLFLYRFYNGIFGKILIEADGFSDIPIIILN
jgi:hypothetical protein